MKRTKIVATIGPSCDSLKMLDKLIKGGVNVARINFSHGTHASNAKAIKNIRAVAKKNKTVVAIIQDLQGPRIRVGEIDHEGFDLVKNEIVYLTYTGKQNNGQILKHKLIPVDLPNIEKLLKKNSRVLMHDGLVELKVLNIKDKLVEAKVVKAGVIFSHKGVNIPGVDLGLPVITPKDIEDLKFGLKLGVDYVALSFVSSAKDMNDLRKLIDKFLPKNQVQIMAKIEREIAVKNIKGIIEASDAIMVARGDLGVEMREARVPLVQKEIIRLCLSSAKPVLVATQMLDSMIKNPHPTRAEVSDVANAVIDHADAVMLSGETAFGNYPVEAVEMMAEIITETENSIYDDMPVNYFKEKDLPLTKAVAESVFSLVKEISAKAIVVATDSGYTARMISRCRPQTRIVVLVNKQEVQRQLSLVWGVYPEMIGVCHNLDQLIISSEKLVKQKKFVKKGDNIIVVTGQPVGRSKNMNIVKIHTIS